ncbi:MAG: phosphoribosylanthranilate isomerase [Candidatus Eremiobacteraeota bacterium]|nr:phosphoribosylanthranilate isomerase [Candidatus Eremiobacteraeota bacterium]
MVKVKICGITTLEDALMAVEAGADALGFVFAPSSRQVTPEEAAAIIRSLPPFPVKIGVFVNEDPAVAADIMRRCALQALQFHGDEKPEEVAPFFPLSIKAFRMKKRESLEAMKAYRVGAVLLDSYSPDSAGGTGKTFHWEWAREAARGGIPLILSGGLTAENVREAIRTVRPFAVDVSSGVEKGPGKKDPDRVRSFIGNAKNALGTD